MNERIFIHLILTVGVAFGLYFALSEPYGLTWDRVGGIFLIVFFLWVTKENLKSIIKVEKDVKRAST